MTENTTRSVAFLVAITLAVAAPVATQQNPTATSSAGSASQLYAGLIGDWVGHLEYRDFSSDERVFLPPWLRVTSAGDVKSVQFAYTYDDGPNKTVHELSVVTLKESAATATFTSDRDHSSDTYKAEGLQEFAKTGRGKLLLTGQGVENSKEVDVRITIVVRRNLYTYQKETRPPGKDFQFRDGYTFTREKPPS
jgi:hypothetical protein